MLVKAPWHSPHLCFCAWLLLLQLFPDGIPLSTSDATGAAAAEAKGGCIGKGACGHDAEQLFHGWTQSRAQTRGPLLPSKQRASLQLRGGQGQQHKPPGMPPGIFGLTQDEPADSDEMWESFRSFASSKGMPMPPKDPSTLPHISKEDKEAIWPGGDDVGLDDPRLRYLCTNIPDFGRAGVGIADMETIAAGSIVQVRPQKACSYLRPSFPSQSQAPPPAPSASATTTAPATNEGGAAGTGAGAGAGAHVDGDSVDTLGPDYQAQVIDLQMFLAYEEPSDLRALDYKFSAHLQRFDRHSEGKGHEELPSTYTQSQFLEKFYPQLEADIVDLFESTTNNNLWILALAVAPDGGALIQKIPRAWVRQLSPQEMLSVGIVKGREAGNEGAGSMGLEEGRGLLGAGGCASGGCASKNVMFDLFKAARDGNVSGVVNLITKHAASPYWKDATNENMQAMHIAASNGHSHVCRALYQLMGHRNCVFVRDGRGRTPLHVAAMQGWTVTAQLLLELYDQAQVQAHTDTDCDGEERSKRAEGNTHLYIDAQDDSNRTAIHYAAGCILGREKEGAATCLLLLESGARVDIHDKCEQTALHVAADMGNGEACSVLLRYGSQRDARDKENRTAGDLAWSVGAALALGTSPIRTADLQKIWANLTASQQAAAVARKKTQKERFSSALNDLERFVDTIEDDSCLPDFAELRKAALQDRGGKTGGTTTPESETSSRCKSAVIPML